MLFRSPIIPFSQSLGFLGGSAGRESTCNVGDLGSIPGLGRSPRGRLGNPLQCSCLENPRDGGTWWASVYGVAQSRTRLKRLSSSSSGLNKRKKKDTYEFWGGHKQSMKGGSGEAVGPQRLLAGAPKGRGHASPLPSFTLSKS